MRLSSSIFFYLHKRRQLVVLCGAVLFAVQSVFCWGNETHRMVNIQTIRNLPFSMQMFRDEDFYFGDHAGDADRRKSYQAEEGSKHYIELERYPEFFRGEMPGTLIEMQKLYGESTADLNGTLPYVVLQLVDSLTQTIRRADWLQAKKITADLGHYIADMYSPFNTTTNYDGQLTHNNGIKWRYEIEMMDRYYNQIFIQRIEPKKIEDLKKTIFEGLLFSHQRTSQIIKADDNAKIKTKGKYNSEYYSLFWKNSSKTTNELLQQASNLFTNILFTVWQNANGTKIQWPQSKNNRTQLGEPEYLEPNFPNPFNPKTTIKYSLPGDYFVRLSVFNLFGQEVSLLHEGNQTEGRYEFIFNAEHLPGGIYFVRLQMNNHTEARKMILQK